MRKTIQFFQILSMVGSLLVFSPPGALSKPYMLDVSGGAVSADFANIPISSILNDIGAKTGIKFSFLGGADASGYNGLFSDKFGPLPMRTAIGRLLSDFNCSVISGSDDSIQQVFIFGKKSGSEGAANAQRYFAAAANSTGNSDAGMVSGLHPADSSMGPVEGMLIGSAGKQGLLIAPPSGQGMVIGPGEGMEIGPGEGMEIGPGEGMVIGPGEGMEIGPGEGMVIGPGEGMKIGPPEGMATGPPEGMVIESPEGMATGPPEGMVIGPAKGMATGPPEGMVVGSPSSEGMDLALANTDVVAATYTGPPMNPDGSVRKHSRWSFRKKN